MNLNSKFKRNVALILPFKYIPLSNILYHHKYYLLNKFLKTLIQFQTKLTFVSSQKSEQRIDYHEYNSQLSINWHHNLTYSWKTYRKTVNRLLSKFNWQMSRITFWLYFRKLETLLYPNYYASIHR